MLDNDLEWGSSGNSGLVLEFVGPLIPEQPPLLGPYPTQNM